MRDADYRHHNKYWTHSRNQPQGERTAKDAEYGRNFGENARPYGEDYGEDSHYPGAYEDYQRDRFRSDRRSVGNSRAAGFRYADQERDWWDRAGDEVLTWFGDDYAERRRRKDETHRGKGPRNYKRSDERIREDINDELTDEWDIDASDIEVTVTDGEVVLSGYVMNKFQKRRAEDLADDVRGVTHVENRLRVSFGQR